MNNSTPNPLPNPTRIAAGRRNLTAQAELLKSKPSAANLWRAEDAARELLEQENPGQVPTSSESCARLREEFRRLEQLAADQKEAAAALRRSVLAELRAEKLELEEQLSNQRWRNRLLGYGPNPNRIEIRIEELGRAITARELGATS